MSIYIDNATAGGSQQCRPPGMTAYEDSEVVESSQQLLNPSVLPASAARYADIQPVRSEIDGSLNSSGNGSMGLNNLHPGERLHKPRAKTSSATVLRRILKTPTPYFDVLRLPPRGTGSIEHAAPERELSARNPGQSIKKLRFAEGTLPEGIAAFDKPLGRNKANWPQEILEEMDRGVEKWIIKCREMEAGGKFVPSEREERMIQGALRKAHWQGRILAKKAREKKGKQGTKMKGLRATRMKAKKADLKARTAGRIDVQMTSKIEETKATRIGGRKEAMASESTAKHRSVMMWLGLTVGDEE